MSLSSTVTAQLNWFLKISNEFENGGGGCGGGGGGYHEAGNSIGSPSAAAAATGENALTLSGFDIRKRVFDFGDGKNVQNAERIDKIFRYKQRPPHTPTFTASFLQNSTS